MLCCVHNCKNKVDSKKMCSKHYKRVLRHGDFNYVSRRENGSGHINKNGYKYFLVGYRKSGSPIYNGEHRIVIENKLGRKLSSNEVVHHKDGNGINNSENNLEIMTKSRHSTLHHPVTRFNFKNGTIYCSKCGQHKPYSDYYVSSVPSKHGYSAFCKKCHLENNKKYRQSKHK